MEEVGTENGISGVGRVLGPGIVPAVPARPKLAPVTFSGPVPGPISLPDRRFVVTIEMYCYRLSCAEAVGILLRFACRVVRPAIHAHLIRHIITSNMSY